MQNPQIPTKENRHFKRWPTSIPCTVLWEDQVITGKLENISFGGALIASPNAIPPIYGSVILAFNYKAQVVLTAQVESQVIHRSAEALEIGGIGNFGVKFQEPLERIRRKLSPLLKKLRGNTSPPATVTREPKH